MKGMCNEIGVLGASLPGKVPAGHVPAGALVDVTSLECGFGSGA